MINAAAVSELGGPEWLRRDRRAAWERFEGSSLPTDALEEWRYSRIDALELDRYEPVAPGTAAPVSAPLPALAAALGTAATVVEIVDGTAVRVFGRDPAVAVTALSADDSEPVELGAIAGEPDAFVTLNRALAPAPVVVRIGRGAAAPVVVVHRIEAAGRAVFPRVLIQVEPGADGTVAELATGAGGSLVVPVTELDVADGARLGYLAVQELGTEAWQVGLQASRVGRDATLTAAAVALGGRYARLRTDSTLVGPGGTSRLLAVYFGTGSQMHDFRTVQGHHAPHTTSDLLYKGVVANQARSVYTGLIRVEKGARGTNAFQTNRNLVLHEGAHADSVPNLEIEDNDVRCSHASTVGPIAEDQRFYLESRGVPPDVADRLIALGFLDEVLEQVPVSAARDIVRVELVAKLAQAEEAEGRHA